MTDERCTDSVVLCWSPTFCLTPLLLYNLLPICLSAVTESGPFHMSSTVTSYQWALWHAGMVLCNAACQWVCVFVHAFWEKRPILSGCIHPEPSLAGTAGSEGLKQFDIMRSIMRLKAQWRLVSWTRIKTIKRSTCVEACLQQSGCCYRSVKKQLFYQ